MTDVRPTAHRSITRWLALLVPVVVGAVLAFLRSGMEASTAAMVLVLAVVGVAATGDRVAGVIAAISAAGSFDFFLTEPYYSFSIHHRDDLELAIALVVVGLAVTEIALWGRAQQAVAARRDDYLQGLSLLLDLPSDSDAEGRRERRARVTDAVARVLGADRAEWVAGHPRWNDAVVGTDGRVRAGGRLLAVERVGLLTEGYTAVPVTRGGAMVGHVRVVASTHVVRPSAEQLRVAVLLADRVLDGTPRPQPAS